MTFFEDYEIGQVTELGSHRFTAEDIVRFASAFDPQPFHVDEDAAANSHFGGLVASGWHTGAVMMRLLVEHRRRRLAEAVARNEPVGRIGPSPGFEDLRWVRPVRAGDVIGYRSTVLAKRDWPKRPGWGLLSHRNEGFNQDGELVFAMTGHVLVERRAPVAAAEPAVTDAAEAAGGP